MELFFMVYVASSCWLLAFSFWLSALGCQLSAFIFGSANCPQLCLWVEQGFSPASRFHATTGLYPLRSLFLSLNRRVVLFHMIFPAP